MKQPKIPLNTQIRQRITNLNGAEFSYKLVSDLKNGAVALSQLTGTGEIRILRMQRDPGARPERFERPTPWFVANPTMAGLNQ